MMDTCNKKIKQPKSKKIRLDELLTLKGLADSIDYAKRLILAGNIICNDQLITSSSTMVDFNSSIRLKNLKQYVGRGAYKLQGACKDLGLDQNFFSDKIVLDIGASTGGFSDYALQNGARYVIALDVGTNQLAWKLRSNPQIICIDHTNIKDFDKNATLYKINQKEQQHKQQEEQQIYQTASSRVIDSIDIVLADISFNSLSKLSSYIVNGTKSRCFILLVKPQFELPRSDIPDGGIVKDPLLQHKAIKLVEDSFIKLGFTNMRSVPSRIKGQFGNQEYFLFISK